MLIACAVLGLTSTIILGIAVYGAIKEQKEVDKLDLELSDEDGE